MLIEFNIDEIVRIISEHIILKHTHTSTHMHAHPQGDRTAGSLAAAASANTEPLARSLRLFFSIGSFAQRLVKSDQTVAEIRLNHLL